MLKNILFAICIILTPFSLKAEDRAFIATVYGTIAEKHSTPVDIEELAVSGLKSISETDKNLVFSKSALVK